MALTNLEKVLGTLIVVLAIWAWAAVHVFHQLRGPFSYPSLSEKADILHQIPPDWQRLGQQ